MTDIKPQEQTQLSESIKTALGKARQKTATVARIDTGLFAFNVITPAVATFLAGLTSIVGGNNLIPPAESIISDGGWRLACILVAAFSFVATIGSAFKKPFEDRLSRGNQCVGRLLSLDLAMTAGNRSREETSWEYGEIVRNYPDFVS
ncbi:MAG: hypothetical protein HYZ23_02870 [Chloroflexi bacterium]|nr:hypothetical protein [Chloroflexota bacterium]